MAYYSVCPKCGGTLDPGEPCDCEEEKEREQNKWNRLLMKERSTNQLVVNWDAEKEMV